MARSQFLIGGGLRAAANLARLTAATILALIIATGFAGPSSAEAIKLQMVGSWAPGVSRDADIAIRFMEEVNKNGKGKVEIVYKGSKEVVPTFDQPEALVRGVFDIWYGAPNYWAGIVPAGYITEMARTDIPDLGPGSKLYDFMVKMYEAKGVQYLGHFAGDAKTGAHAMYVQKEISKVSDLKGRKIRVPPLTRFFVKAVGGEPVTLPPGEIYIAVDRGTVDGFTWPYFDGFTNFGWHKITKFLIDEPLYRNGIGINVNLDKWKSLPEDVQKIMIDAVGSTQAWAQGWIAAHEVIEQKIMLDAGMKKIELSDEESKKWATIANDSMWAHFKTAMSAENYSEARKLLGYE